MHKINIANSLYLFYSEFPAFYTPNFIHYSQDHYQNNTVTLFQNDLLKSLDIFMIIFVYKM